ncbi:uncharacterized protein nkd isoform X2 [Bemisia tabaci]|uniref:uncharacterized protein nkd isoform X2 n=1 Tax=Bemisia tabaci TaxID=7038 RepID=UPI0008F9CF2A|nr:PREDICTED: protein naked cuticle homolog 1 isoform X2 [Bemisia tabaci]
MCFASFKGGQLVFNTQMNEMHMANHLVRWWKTKVINGYKHFTVLPSDCNDGRPSDTEELLGMPFYDNTCTDPPTKMTNLDSEKSPNSPKCSAKKQLKFEEFECDLSVEGGVNGQEFSFTLYDFDGHGKITKDDIAGLVTTIYETIGSSIRVPHYGSKTIKVKLTVSPDKAARARAGGDAAPGDNNNAAPKKRDLNVTIRERRTPGHPRRGHKSNLRRRHSISSSAPSEDRHDIEADISEEENDAANERLSTNNNNSDSLSPQNNCCSRTKKRSSSLQRQELLQIIQANMEKNNLCFQTSRKHCGLDSSFPNHHRNRHKRHSSFHQSSTQCPAFSPQYTNKLFPTNKNQSPNNNISTPGYVTPNKASPAGYFDSAAHQRNFNESPQLNHFINEDKLKSSPHHLKHRHREQDQARAMAQVVKWLEQEVFKPSPNHRSKSKHTEKHTTKTTENRSKSCNDKHEHHHIHEHVHHHYHHYNESPVVV